jgi:hypothetical protein
MGYAFLAKSVSWPNDDQRLASCSKGKSNMGVVPIAGLAEKDFSIPVTAKSVSIGDTVRSSSKSGRGCPSCSRDLQMLVS